MAWFRMMGVDSVDYHRRTVLGREDDHAGPALAYYGTRGETPLVWSGAIADRLGLGGLVDEDTYESIFGAGGARDPDLGTRLVDARRPGLELVVSVHKSVAMLGLLGRADDMHAILDAETDATMAFLDTWFQRQGGRRGRGQRRTHTTGLLWARTRHATSRAGDPEPHDHVLVANLTETLDDRGGWKALDTAGIRDLVHAATMAGRLAAAATAVELGYAIEPDAAPSGKLDHWAIAGIPTEVLDLFSKRSEQIDKAISEAGFESYRARGVAARNTRSAKAAAGPASLVLRWLDELDEIGWPTRRLTDRLGYVQDRKRQPLRTLTPADRAALVEGMIGPEGPLAQRKAFTRPDVVRVAAPLLYGCDRGELDHLVSGVFAHPEAIPLVGQPGARGRAWVAASVIATEQAIETIADRLTQHVTAPAVTEQHAADAVSRKEAAIGAPLTDGQRRAVTAITTSGRRLELVVGVAGSGKTTALDVGRAAFEAEGYRVLGTAISGQAARTLQREAGVDSSTIASLVWRLEHRTLTLDPRTVLLVDEAGMTDDRAMLRLLAAAEVGGSKVVVVGDHRQLSAVKPGGGLEALVERHPDAVHVLDQNIRQHDPGERAALERLRTGDVAEAVAWYRGQHRLVTATTREDALDAAVAAWSDDVGSGHDTVLLAWRRRDVAALNQRARQRRLAGGAVDGPELEAPGGRRYAAGDRVVTLAPAGDGRYLTSERATVTAIGRDTLNVTFDDGRTETLAGDDLDPDHLDHAYALTVHRMQGATVDRAHVFADGGGRELAYVAMSRARDTTHAYVVADDPDQAVDDLTTEWSMDQRERWVLDVDEPANEGGVRRPSLDRRTVSALRLARLRAERQAVEAVAPASEHRLRALDMQMRLEAVGQAPSRGLGQGIV